MLTLALFARGCPWLIGTALPRDAGVFRRPYLWKTRSQWLTCFASGQDNFLLGAILAPERPLGSDRGCAAPETSVSGFLYRGQINQESDQRIFVVSLHKFCLKLQLYNLLH